MKNSNDQPKNKRPYESPEIQLVCVELEHSIAAGSAAINPHDMNNQVLEEWEVDPDDNRTINW